MSTATIERPVHQPVEPVDDVVVAEPVVALKRRTIDSVLIGFGVVATAAFVVAGGLLDVGPQLLQRLRRRRAVVAEHHASRPPPT